VNRAPRRIFELKRDKVTGGCRKLHNEVLHKLYCSPSIISTVKSKRMRWAGHVARMWRRRIYIEDKSEKAIRVETSRKIKV
jgi:hypothetical protein